MQLTLKQVCGVWTKHRGHKILLNAWLNDIATNQRFANQFVDSMVCHIAKDFGWQNNTLSNAERLALEIRLKELANSKFRYPE